MYSNPWIALDEHKVLNPAGKPGIYGVVHFENIAVGVVALDDRDRILMVGQYRFPLKQYSWEIPEGGCPKGETTRSAAKRELLEETGYTARSLKRVLTMHLSNSSTDERAEVFLATGLKAGAAAPEETEVLELKWVPLKTALKQIDNGEITDAITVAALLSIGRQKRI